MVAAGVVALLAAERPAIAQATSESAAWIGRWGQHQDVLEIAASDGTVVLDLEAARVRAIEQSGDRMWLLGDRLRAVEIATGAVLVDLPLPPFSDPDEHEDDEECSRESHDHPGASLAIDPANGNLWVGLDRTVYRMSADGSALGSFQIERPIRKLAFDGTRLWVANPRRIAAHDPASGSVLFVAQSGQGRIRDLDYAASGLWAAVGNKLKRFDSTGAVTAERSIANLRRVSAFSTGVWAVAKKDAFRLDAATSIVATSTRPLGNNKLRAVAADPARGAAWVAGRVAIARLNGDGTVVRLVPLPQGHVRALESSSDTQPPTIAILAPTGVLGTRRPEIVITFADAASGIDAGSLALSLDDGAAVAASCAFTESGATCVPDAPGFAEGPVSLRATIADNQGNTATAVATFAVDVSPAVFLTLSAPADGSLTRDPSVFFSGTLNEPVTLSLAGVPVAVAPDGSFSASHVLAEGSQTVLLDAVDAAGNLTRISRTLTLDTTAPPAPEGGLVFCSESVGELSDCRGEPGSVEGGSTVLLTNLRTGETHSVVSNADGSWFLTVPALPGDALSIHVVDPAGNVGESTSFSVPEEPGEQLPPDPALIAPALDPSVAYDVFEATRFLWESVPPVQSEVVPGSIDPRFVAVLRGVVRTREGEPLPGVTVTAVGSPQFGFTKSRADGVFNFAVNGSGADTGVLEFRKPGFEPAQRRVTVPWRDYVEVPEVRLVALDSVVTVADLSGAGGVHVHRATPTNDDRGYRQLTAIIPSGTTAERVFADGSRESLAEATLSLTEYTVGPNGQAAMPAELPPSSAYTLCFSLTAMEEGDAVTTELSQPAVVYFEDFYALGPGMVIPVGTYSFESARWIAEENGLTVETAGVVNGRAQLIVDASGLPADDLTLESLGISVEERETLASLYPTPGIGLSRVTRRHFSSPVDPNVALAQNEPSPTQTPSPIDPLPDSCKVAGSSTVQCQNQTLGEAFPIQGTPHSIVYSSDRVPGRVSERTLRIPLTGDELPENIVSVALAVDVAGQHFAQSFAPAPNLETIFEWDGLDGFGRRVTGSVRAHVRVSYLYPIRVSVTPAGSIAASSPQFGRPGSGFGLLVGGGSNFVVRSLDSYVRLSAADALGVGLGGWTLSSHHQYFPDAGKILLGTGTRRSGDDLRLVIDTQAGGGTLFATDGRQGRLVNLNFPADVAPAPDGSLFISELLANQVWRQLPDGTLQRYAGSPLGPGFSGDGGPAVSAKLHRPAGMALAPDGSLYIADTENHRIRRVTPDGLIDTVAGTGVAGIAGDGGPATSAQLFLPNDVAVGPDGSVFIADRGNNRVRRLGVDGLLTTYAGDGTNSNNFGHPTAEELRDGGPAPSASLWSPQSVSVAPDGSVYIADTNNFRIRKVTPDGIVTTVAGGFSSTRCGNCPATESLLVFPHWVEVAPDGSVVFSEPINHAFDPWAPRKSSPSSTAATLSAGSLIFVRESTAWRRCARSRTTPPAGSPTFTWTASIPPTVGERGVAVAQQAVLLVVVRGHRAKGGRRGDAVRVAVVLPPRTANSRRAPIFLARRAISTTHLGICGTSTCPTDAPSTT